jgi:hypothetical protein
MTQLIEIFSNPNERKCQVRLRTKLSPNSLKEMNGYLDLWTKEADGIHPPEWLRTNFSLENEQKLTFSIKHDLLSKEWFVDSIAGHYTPAPLKSYSTAINLNLMEEINQRKESNERSKERGRILRESYRVGPPMQRDGAVK